jgi:hypothetical protein
MHAETMAGIRWTRGEVERHRDGLDVATLELDAPERAGMELLSHWPIMEMLGRIGGGRGLEEASRLAIAAASAVGLITCEGTSRDSYFRGGRAAQRMWLAATARGLAIQPLTALPYLIARMERGGGAGLSPAQQD